MTILLNDILNMNPENVTIRLMTTNDEGVEPFNEFQEDRNNIDTWLFWRWKNKYFEIGDTVIALVKWNDKYVLAGVKKVTQDLNIENGKCFEGESLTEYDKYIGRLVVNYERTHQQCKIYLKEKYNELIVDSILQNPLF